ARAEPPAGSEVPLAGHVVDLDADAVGVLEEDRIVAGCELRALFRPVNDVCRELVDREAMDRIDIRAAARAQAEVMQPCSILIETDAALLVRRAAHQDARAAADAVDDVVAPDQGLHRQEVAELLPERHALIRVVDVELDVGDAVDLDGHERSFAVDAGGGRHHRSASGAGQCESRGAGREHPMTEWDARGYHRVSALQQWLAEKNLARL